MALVLLVEDDTPLLNLYEGALLDEHEVIAVGTAQEALNAIDTRHPHVIVLDLNLPDAPGSSILKHIQDNQQFADIGVIVMTGFARHSRNLPDFVLDVMSKPVTISTLLRTVNAALKHISTT